MNLIHKQYAGSKKKIRLLEKLEKAKRRPLTLREQQDLIDKAFATGGIEEAARVLGVNW